MRTPTKQSPPKGSEWEVLTANGTPPPLGMEFKPNDLASVFAQVGLSIGRCFGSKSGYRRTHPRSIFVANANVFSLKHGKLWWGDLDIRPAG
jgi:hypothetical protein